jgi:prepilin-type N-terminal cleavage/methylation domain-containing protein
MNRNLKAFSLIELSIVILVIGVLIAGVSQGGKMITKFQISAAASLTNSSPVHSIKNLVAWYETTTEKSFIASESDDGQSVSTWYDINTQQLQKRNATSSGTSKSTYKISSDTGLPMLYFDGSDDYFSLPDNTIPAGNSSFTTFVVDVRQAKPGYITLYSSGSFGTTQINLLRYEVNQVVIYSFLGASGSNVNLVVSPSISNWGKSINMATYNNDITNRIVEIYRSGIGLKSAAANFTLNMDTTFNYIGKIHGNTPQVYKGYIGELIIFDRYLKKEERESVKAYLSQKWGIKT